LSGETLGFQNFKDEPSEHPCHVTVIVKEANSHSAVENKRLVTQAREQRELFYRSNNNKKKSLRASFPIWQPN